MYIEAVYTGTSGCTLHKRMTEHQTAIDKKDMKNAMAKHMTVFHPDQTPDFTSKILGKYRYNMTRYIAESINSPYKLKHM